MPATLCFLLTLSLWADTHAQLIGSRGVFTLPEGVEYRDAVTREASKLVGQFARMFQTEEEKNKKKTPPVTSRAHTPFFGPQVITPGRSLAPAEVLDFQDSRALHPPLDQRKNRVLEEIEVERATSMERLLPDPKDSGTPSSARSSKEFSMFEAVPTPPGSVLGGKRKGKEGIAVRKSMKRLRLQPSPALPSPASRDSRTQSLMSDGMREMSKSIPSHSPLLSRHAPRHPSLPRMNSPRQTLSPGRHPAPSLRQGTRGAVRRSGTLPGSHPGRPRPLSLPFHPTPGPRVFDRTPSSLSDFNSDRISRNVFGLSRMGTFVVRGPNYSISWG